MHLSGFVSGLCLYFRPANSSVLHLSTFLNFFEDTVHIMSRNTRFSANSSLGITLAHLVGAKIQFNACQTVLTLVFLMNLTNQIRKIVIVATGLKIQFKTLLLFADSVVVHPLRYVLFLSLNDSYVTMSGKNSQCQEKNL